MSLLCISSPQLISFQNEANLEDKMTEKETSLIHQLTSRQRTNTALYAVTITTIALAIIFGAPWITLIGTVSLTLSLRNNLKNTKTAKLVKLVQQDRLDLDSYKKLFNSFSESSQIFNLEETEAHINSENYQEIKHQLMEIADKFDLQVIQSSLKDFSVDTIVLDKRDSKFNGNLDKSIPISTELTLIKDRLSISFNYLQLAIKIMSKHLDDDVLQEEVNTIKTDLKTSLSDLKSTLVEGRTRIKISTRVLLQKYQP